MSYISQLLSELSSRLPELEWKISSLSTPISAHSLPKGLFRLKEEQQVELACIAEIKADIDALSQQENTNSALYLAERIKQKVNVLVTLCQIDSRKPQSKQNNPLSLKMLSTRQQWIQGLEQDIDSLTEQYQAMKKALEQMKKTANTAALLNVQAELGFIEKRLTLARETLHKALAY